MDTIRSVASTAPEIFLLLAIALGTFLGRLKIAGFSIGATACTLVVAVILGQFGNFVIPPLFKAIFFSLFVFTIGYKSGPEFFASLSIRTLSQVGVALVVAFTGLAIVLAFAFTFHLDSGTAAGLAAGALTQSSVIGTASGALAQLGLCRRCHASAAGEYRGGLCRDLHPWLHPDAVVCALCRTLAHGRRSQEGSRQAGSGAFRRQGAARPETSGTRNSRRGLTASRSLPGRRSVRSRIVLASVSSSSASSGAASDVEPERKTVLESGDEIVLAGPTAALVRAGASIGPEIEGAEALREVRAMRSAFSSTIRPAWPHVARNSRPVGDAARGVFLRDLMRRGQEVPVTPQTRIYLGDVMTLVGATHDVERAAAKVGQVMRYGDKTDIAFLAAGIRRAC